MGLDALNSRLKEISDFDAEKEIYRFIKSDLSHLFLQANKDQLFVKSQDIFGLPLGYYSWTPDHLYDKDKNKDYNTPYTMVDSGELERGMFIKVYYRKITINSTSKHGDLFQAKTGKRIFGVQQRKTTQIINRWIIPMLKEKLSFH